MAALSIRTDLRALACCIGAAALVPAAHAQGVPEAAAPAQPASGSSEAAPQPVAQPGPQIVGAPQTFSILVIDVAGVTVLPQAEVETIVYGFLGPDKTTADVESARKALQDAYSRAGYEAAVVEVPPQPQEDFAAGLIRISVIEAPVAKVAVTGSKHHSDKRVLAQMESLKEGQPLNFKALQRDLEAANRFPDREINPAFDAGDQPGTLNVDLKVRDEFPWHASAELTNDHSPNTTELRATGSARYTNLWGLGHTISLGYSVAPRRRADSEAYFGSYTLPFLGSPWTLALSGYKSNSNIAALGGTNVLGNGYQVGAQAIWRMPTKRDYHALRFGADYKDFKQNIGVAGAAVSSAPIRYVPLVVGYSFAANREKWSMDLGITSTLGLRLMKRVGCFVLNTDPATCVPEDQFTNRELDAVENFAHINLDATYTRMLGNDWVAQLRLAGQYADSHLVSNEQFAIGGASSLRGYLQSEAVGDRGINGAIELRLPSVATRIGNFVDELRLYAFADGGIVSLIGALPGTTSVYRLGSVGGGLKLKLLGHLSGDVFVALPLVGTVESPRGDPRVTFSVKGEF